MSEKKKVVVEDVNVEIKPLKDFICSYKNVVHDLKKGKTSEVPKSLLLNLKTEKVIK